MAEATPSPATATPAASAAPAATATSESTSKATPAAPAASVATPVKVQPNAAQAAQPAASTPGADAAKLASEAAQAEPQKPATPEKDEVAETMARLNREAREVAKAKKALEASQKSISDKVKLGETMASAREALGKKDFLGALTVLAGEAGLDPDEAAVLLLEQASSREKPPLTENDIERIAEEKLKAKEEAARKEAEERGNAELERGKQVYGSACAQAYKADPSKFPLISAYSLDDKQIFDWVIAEAKRNNGHAPSPAQTLEHFEQQFRARFEKAASALGYAKAVVQQPGQATQPQPGSKPTPTAPAADSGGSVTVGEKPKRETLKEYNERIRAQFRARRQQTA